MFEAQLGCRLLYLLLQPGLRAHQVLDELGHPPDRRVTVQAVQAWGQVLGDGQRQVRGARVEAVHYRQLHHLDVLIVGLSWNRKKEHSGLNTDCKVKLTCLTGRVSEAKRH